MVQSLLILKNSLCQSEWPSLRNAVSGVPQGSILGPLLFVLYINDLPHILSSAKPYLFADNTKCLHISPPESDDILLQNDIDILTTYSNSWYLHFNETKCVHLHFQFNSTSYSTFPNITLTTKRYVGKTKQKTWELFSIQAYVGTNIIES